jgi:DNA-3-methyladenine glycosylase II
MKAKKAKKAIDLPDACASGAHAAAVRHLAEVEPRFVPWIAASGACGLPSAGRPDPQHLFEGLVHAIVAQQLSGKAADTIFGRVRALGRDGRLEPGRLATMPVEPLRAAGLSGAKTAGIKDLATRVASGGLALAELSELDDDAIVDRLVEVRGIGRWTAQMALMFRFGRPDVLPTLDLGVRKGAMKLVRARARPDEARLERIARPWRPHRSVACWYLWRIAEAK